MIITNSRYALVGYFITSYPTQAHGIIVIDSNNDNAKHNNNDYTYNDSKPEEKMLKISIFLIAGVQRVTIDLGGLLSTQETRIALGYRLVRLLRFFRA